MSDPTAGLRASMKSLRQKGVEYRLVAPLHDAIHTLAAIDEMHQPWPNRRECVSCELRWPCPTHRLLYPEET